MKICLATKNPGKLSELLKIAEEVGKGDIDLILAPNGFDPEETGSTFQENAIIKATEAAKLSGMLSVADDSGLCVDALNGRPGIYSARYSEGDEAKGRQKLLAELKEIPEGKRGAAFVCAMAAVKPDGEVAFVVEKRWAGKITFEESGNNGFGYDPIFVPEGMTITSAELDSDKKNLLSHRGQAWREVLTVLCNH